MPISYRLDSIVFVVYVLNVTGQAKQAVGESSLGAILLSIAPGQFRTLHVGLGPVLLALFNRCNH